MTDEQFHDVVPSLAPAFRRDGEVTGKFMPPVPSRGIGELLERIAKLETRVEGLERVESLNARQLDCNLHPYTCGNDSGHARLVATRSGWVCPECSYRQKL